MKLRNDIIRLQKSALGKKVEKRLAEFKSPKTKDRWFAELCFCILTANSKASTATAIEKEVGVKGFLTYSQAKLSKIIKNNNHRFHNNKAKYIVEARKHRNIKDRIKKIIIKDNFKHQVLARQFIVDNIKGLGYKEASHFLRNVGYFALAILDRHILNLMVDNKVLKEKPKSLTKKNYFAIEKKFFDLAKSMKMSPAQLDFYMWCLKSGEVLK